MKNEKKKADNSMIVQFKTFFFGVQNFSFGKTIFFYLTVPKKKSLEKFRKINSGNKNAFTDLGHSRQFFFTNNG